ncbi:ATP-dependent nuclease [Pseudomonas orientalis]|uniref:ATP-dependent nuclease n=1 Tax=Pseudomonas orientalis TaxID=76758 RepID=UPI0034D3AB47
MYLQSLRIQGFRRFDDLSLRFKSGLNIIVGPNNAGKTAVVDALRVLLSASDEGNLRLTELDLHQQSDGLRRTSATFTYVFSGLSDEDEADYLTALVPIRDLTGRIIGYEAMFSVQYTQTEPGGRLRLRRWVGLHEDNVMTTDMLEELRAIYLRPLRDPALGLKPGRMSQISKLIQRLATDEQRRELELDLKDFDMALKTKPPISSTNSSLTTKHESMLGSELAQVLALELTSGDFNRFAARVGLAVGGMEIEQNGLGFNNLIYMAVVLSELALNTEATYCGLIVEEPEAHLHPQLQAVLLDYLRTVEKPEKGERAVQVFVTSHSPNFAALADIDSICCVYESPNGPAAFAPRDATFAEGKKEKLQRYLNVTRAELFFARRLILVEGTAELFLVEALATKAGFDLRKNSVSVISTDGLNFDAFLPLFGVNAMQIPTAVITDADPPASYFPEKDSALQLSANALLLKKTEDEFVRCFFSKKTLEYDLALEADRRHIMIDALKEMHPLIGKALETEIDEGISDSEKAKLLYCGMFQRGESKDDVQKGRYSQVLAYGIATSKTAVTTPPYLVSALNFVTGVMENTGG